jgi:DNA-binding NarL/FixJ family response regulator
VGPASGGGFEPAPGFGQLRPRHDHVCLVGDQQPCDAAFAPLDLVDDIEVVGKPPTATPPATIAACAPDVVLLDLRLPGGTASACSRSSPPRHAAAGDHPHHLDDEAAVLGAIGRRPRPCSGRLARTPADGIRAVARGESVIQPAHRALLRRRARHGVAFREPQPPDPLTEREVEVLRLLTGGYSNREIADALEISEGTVKNHLSTILSKLGVRDRTRAVLKALELGLV